MQTESIAFVNTTWYAHARAVVRAGVRKFREVVRVTPSKASSHKAFARFLYPAKMCSDQAFAGWIRLVRVRRGRANIWILGGYLFASHG